MTIQEKNKILKKAIRDGGYYGPNGIWNSIVTISGDDRIYRKRVETLIIRNKKEVFCKKKPSGEYQLPGGSTEKDVPDIKQAANECREESRIKVKNIQPSGITYREIKKPGSWAKDYAIVWDGYITDVYTGEYDSMDHEKVDQVDKDPFIASGRFYSFKDFFKFARKEHREALSQYIQNMNKDKEDVIKESYVSNYFKNKKLLKQIGKVPEIDISAIDMIISKLEKSYFDLKSSSKVKRSIEKGTNEDIFYPIINFTFPDNHEITICLSFYPEITDGSAISTEEYGDLVMIYPCYFKNSKEGKRFTLLHEIGHIRLEHINEKNVHRKFIFGADDTNDYRTKLALKGKSMYTEINADLYAILSGAKMYSILDSTFRKDTTKENDYRVTNVDLANRYKEVYKKYNNYRNLFEFSTYDLFCLGIHEFIQENTEELNELDKRNLFNFIYEYCIKEPVRKSSNDDRINKIDKEFDKEVFNSLMKECIDNIDLSSNNSFTTFIDMKNIVKEYIYEYMNDIHSNFRYNIFTENKLDKSIYYYDEIFSSVLENASSKNYTTEACKNKEEAIKFITEVRKLAEKFNANFFIVTDGVSGYSNGNGKSDIAVKNARNKHIEWEKEHGFDPDEDWSKNPVKESVMLETKRSNLPDSAFGIIVDGKRKYPLDTKKHVLSAIRLFGHCEKKYEVELAKKIFSAMKKYHISKNVIGEKNGLRKYL